MPVVLLLALLLATPVAAATATADSLWTSGDHPGALALVEADIAAARAAADTTAWIAALTTRGRYLKNMEDPAGAEAGLRRALDLAAAAGDSALACAPRRWLGVALSAQGRNAEAAAQFERLVAQAAALRDTLHEAWANVGLGWDTDLRRDHPAARDFYARAAALFTAAGDGEGALWAELGEANAHFHLGDYEGAAAGWERVARTARREGFSRHEAITRNNVAGLQFALGRPDESLRHYTRAVAVWDSLGQAWERMPPALNRASCLALLGRADEARAALETELATCRNAGFADYEARCLRKLADLERDQGNTPTAEALYREALDLGDERPALERVGVLIGLADVQARQGDHDGSLATLDRAEPLLADDHTSQIRLQLDLARAAALIRLGRTAEAVPLLDRADAVMGDARARHGLECELLRASVAEAVADAPAALAALERAAALWEEERSLPLDPDWREERGAAGRRLFARLGAAVLAADGPAAAFDRLQSVKARTLRERLAGPGVILSDTLAVAPTAAELRSRVLAPREVLLDTYLGAGSGLLFALTRDTLVAASLPPADSLAVRLLAWRDALADPATPQDPALADALRHDLLGAVEPLLATAAAVILVPDGPLNLAPLSLLAPGHAVWTRVPSTSILRDLHLAHAAASAPAAADLLILTAAGDDGLVGAAWQSRRLTETLRGVSVHAGPVTAADLAGHDVLHAAAHVRPDDRNAWQSAVLLGPGAELRAVEVAAMDLDARLVVLASCGSATGRVLSGEGVQGLAAAFAAAGAPAVVASLWPVDDDLTALLMDRFYRHLADGLAAAPALAAARADLRADAATADPIAWAGFVMIGDGETAVPLRRTKTGPPALVWAGGLLVVIGGLVVLGRKRRS